MKIEQFDIIFDDAETNPNAVYLSGQTVAFKVHLRLREAVKCRSVTVTLLGKSTVQWSEKSGKTSTTYRSDEFYINHTVSLYTPQPDGPNAGTHPPGEHFYPVTFELPATSPSSLECPRSHIRYEIKASIDKPWKADDYAKKLFTVIRPLDLNAQPTDLTGPFSADESVPVTVCFCCTCCYGSVHTGAAVAKRGFVPGEQIHVTGEIRNDSGTDLDIVLMDIYQRIVSHAEGKHVTDERVASSVQLPPIGQGETLKLNHLLPVAAMASSFLEGCSNIELNNYFRIRAGDGCCVSFDRKVCEVVIGTVPLRNYLMIALLPPPDDAEAGAPPPPLTDDEAERAPLQAAAHTRAAGGTSAAAVRHAAECTFGRVALEKDAGRCHCSQDQWAPSYPMLHQQPQQQQPLALMQQQQQQQDPQQHLA